MKKLMLLVALFLCVNLINEVQAQCDCSAVNSENQAINGNFSNGNTGFLSDLNSVQGCSNTSYFIGTQPYNKCSNWPTSLWDHTLMNSAGKYMLVDGPKYATSAPPNRIWYTSVTVQQGQSYNFSWWMRHQFSGPFVDMNFSAVVDGQTIGSFSTENNIDWHQHSFCYTAETHGTVEIAIRQDAPYGSPTYDYGIDDIVFRNCTPPPPEPCLVSADFDWTSQYDGCGVTFENLTTTGDETTILSYQWVFDDGFSSAEESPTHFYNDFSPNGFNVCLTVFGVTEEGECCSDTYCENVAPKCGLLNPPCEAEITDIRRINLGGCAAALSVDFTANKPLIGATWNFGDGTTEHGGVNITHQYPAGGIYTICVTLYWDDNGNCCSETFCKNVKVICIVEDDGSGKEDSPSSNDFQKKLAPSTSLPLKVFPNPATNRVSVLFESATNADFQLELTSLTGKSLRVIKGQAVAGENTFEMETTDIGSGTYVISLLIDDKKESEKVIIIK